MRQISFYNGKLCLVLNLWQHQDLKQKVLVAKISRVNWQGEKIEQNVDYAAVEWRNV